MEVEEKIVGVGSRWTEKDGEKEAGAPSRVTKSMYMKA
jgi:hypothetical protein